MWKIIKKSIEKIVVDKQKFSLWMKWEFKIEFANDSFWPYNFKFEREDCYFVDWLWDRGTKIFPLRNKSFDNTEIFLETDDIVIAVWERWSLLWWDKDFIDIINIKTEKKYRLFTNEVNLIFNSADKVVINALDEWVFKTIVLDINTLLKIEEIEEELQAFFKCVYNKKTKEWFLLDFNAKINNWKYDDETYKSGSFVLQKIDIKWEPKNFDREKFEVITNDGKIDIWAISILWDK